jgi:hypothetical protein
MTNFSNYLEEELIDFTLRLQAAPTINSIYIGLANSYDITDGSSFEEVATGDTSYARQGAAFDAPVDGVTQNTALIQWTAAASEWGTITHIGIFDADTAGNILYWAQLATERTVGEDDVFQIPAGNLTVTLT